MLNTMERAHCRECGAGLPSLSPDPEPELSPFLCPACGVTMKTGELAVDRDNDQLATWAAAWSWLSLRYRQGGQKSWESLMDPYKPSPAARCPRCGGVWFSPPPPG
ncbi:MAG TPA: hypothetical protein VFR81_17480 [Longimicrobium sp.]|nr:hypothetical protein [Longimicrobium sp.]